MAVCGNRVNKLANSDFLFDFVYIWRPISTRSGSSIVTYLGLPLEDGQIDRHRDFRKHARETDRQTELQLRMSQPDSVHVNYLIMTAQR